MMRQWRLPLIRGRLRLLSLLLVDGRVGLVELHDAVLEGTLHVDGADLRG